MAGQRIARRSGAGLSLRTRLGLVSLVDKLLPLERERLNEGLSVARCVIVELVQPRRVTRGLSDLVVRRGVERNVPAALSTAMV